MSTGASQEFGEPVEALRPALGHAHLHHCGGDGGGIEACLYGEDGLATDFLESNRREQCAGRVLTRLAAWFHHLVPPGRMLPAIHRQHPPRSRRGPSANTAHRIIPPSPAPH